MRRIGAVLFSLVIFTLCFVRAAQMQQETFPLITAENVDKLRLVFVRDGQCTDFSQDGSRVVVQTRVTQPNGSIVPQYSVYDTISGTLIFGLVGDFASGAKLSPDGKILAVMSFDPYPSMSHIDSTLGVYDLASGERHFPKAVERMSFSNDSALIAVGDTVYETQTWKPLAQLPEGVFAFSPDGSMVAAGDGIYDIATEKKRITVTKPNAVNFSLNNKILAVDRDAVYDLSTGARLFSNNHISAGNLSPDGSLIVIEGDGVYDIATGNRLFKIGGQYIDDQPGAQFSPDETLVAVDRVGVYDVKTGQLLYAGDFSGGFSSDSTLVAFRGLYDARTARRRFDIAGPLWATSFHSVARILVERYEPCAIFAVSDVAPRGAVSVPLGVNIRQFPAANAPIVTTTTESTTRLAYARMQDGGWYKLGDGQWVAAQVVTPVYMPDTPLPLQ